MKKAKNDGIFVLSTRFVCFFFFFSTWKKKPLDFLVFYGKCEDNVQLIVSGFLHTNAHICEIVFCVNDWAHTRRILVLYATCCNRGTLLGKYSVCEAHANLSECRHFFATSHFDITFFPVQVNWDAIDVLSVPADVLHIDGLFTLFLSSLDVRLNVKFYGRDSRISFSQLHTCVHGRRVQIWSAHTCVRRVRARHVCLIFRFFFLLRYERVFLNLVAPNTGNIKFKRRREKMHRNENVSNGDH